MPDCDSELHSRTPFGLHADNTHWTQITVESPRLVLSYWTCTLGTMLESLRYLPQGCGAASVFFCCLFFQTALTVVVVLRVRQFARASRWVRVRAASQRSAAQRSARVPVRSDPFRAAAVHGRVGCRGRASEASQSLLLGPEDRLVAAVEGRGGRRGCVHERVRACR